MALPRKGSRLIDVDGESYRWRVLADDLPRLGIVVESAEGPAQRLVVSVQGGNVVSPKLVREAIVQGLEQGWTPAMPGREIRTRLHSPGDGELHPCPCCDYRTLGLRRDYEVCPVCFWEDDGVDLDDLDRHSGPNHMTLREGRANFNALGACDEKSLEHVLSPERRAEFLRIHRARP